MSMLMEEDDAKYVLDYVEKKMVSRGEQRKAAEETAAACEESHRVKKGAARAAKRAAIAARPVPAKRWVDNAGRVHMY